MNRLYTLLILLLLHVCNMIAVPAHPGSSKVQQPDGTYVTIRLYGDEWLHYQTTDDGYTIIKNPQGYYVYAMLQDGELFPTNLTAHDPEERSESELAFLNETQKHIKPVMDEDMLKTKQQLDQIQQQTLASRRAGSYDYTKFRGLIILVEFNDKKFMRPDYKTIIDDMVNKENYTGYDNERYTGSVYDYFKDNSEGKFLPHFDIAGPYTINYSQYYPKGTQNAGIICKEVTIAADADVDYSGRLRPVTPSTPSTMVMAMAEPTSYSLSLQATAPTTRRTTSACYGPIAALFPRMLMASRSETMSAPLSSMASRVTPLKF